MTGSTTRILAAGLLMLSAASGCATSPTTGAIDRLKPDAVAHAKALAGDDMAEARETGLALLAKLGALAGW